MFSLFDVKEIFSVSVTLFLIIDILGAIPTIVVIQSREGKIDAGKATFIAAIIMVLFLFTGHYFLRLFGLDIDSFAVAGSIVIFIVALEMILGVSLIKQDPDAGGSSSVVPLAFPLIAGAGTLTTILSLKAVYAQINILVGILFNLVLVYFVLRLSFWLERVLGPSGLIVLRRAFGVILMAIAVKIFKTHVVSFS